MINRKTLLKSVGYRIFSTLVTSSVALAITGDPKIAFVVGIWDSIFKIILYYFYEIIVEKYLFKKIEPAVIWMTGLSGAGKTTISKEIENILQKNGNKVVMLDGDEIRNMFPSTGFDEESRKTHNRRVAYTAKMLKDQGAVVIVSLISPYKESREDARVLCGDRFFEVFVSTSLEECERRDVKGLYKKVRNGEIKNFTGIDSPYEIPTYPDIVIETEKVSPKECANKILSSL